jgi:hypothetical protein
MSEPASVNPMAPRYPGWRGRNLPTTPPESGREGDW